MSLEITRIYKNSSDEELRIDTIIMEQNMNTMSFIERKKAAMTYKRRVTKTTLNTTATRTVASIELIGTYDSCETSSNDFLYAIWNDASGSEMIRCNMSDLPGVGDSV